MSDMFNKKDLKYYVCPICKSDLHLGKNKLICRKCKNNFRIIEGVPIFLTNKISPENYEKQTSYFDKEFSDLKYDIEPWQITYNKRMSDVFPKNKKANYLDLGCGSGYAVLHFSKKYGIVFGCDLSINSILRLKNICDANKIRNIKLCVASAEYLPYKKDIFDMISSNAVIEHVPNEKEYVNELLRISKRESVFFITGPLKFRYVNPLFWILNIINDRMVGHLRRYDEKRFKKIFKNKAKIHRIFYTGHFMKSIITLINLFLRNKYLSKKAEVYDDKLINKKYGANNISIVLKRKL